MIGWILGEIAALVVLGSISDDSSPPSSTSSSGTRRPSPNSSGSRRTPSNRTHNYSSGGTRPGGNFTTKGKSRPSSPAKKTYNLPKAK